MKAILDPKSVILGALTAVALACVIGANGPAGSEVGRFQIRANEQHAFVLDTVTGKVWEKYLTPGRGTIDKDFASTKVND